MIVPMDDHLVTRGDGVFETLRAINHQVYLFDAHLERFWRSAKTISLEPPMSQAGMKEIILETLKIANHPDTMIRAYLSRGPGNFSVNPYEPTGPQFYLAVTKFNPTPAEKYEKGVNIGISKIPGKPSWLARMKSCNYLPNVLMRKEAIDRGLDYVLGLDDQNYLTESATENFIIIDSAGILTCPMPDFILQGTTMGRLFNLAKQQGWKTAVRPILMDDLLQAQDVMMIGTSFGLLPVTKFENKILGTGVPSERFKQLLNWLLADMGL